MEHGDFEVKMKEVVCSICKKNKDLIMEGKIPFCLDCAVKLGDKIIKEDIKLLRELAKK